MSIYSLIDNFSWQALIVFVLSAVAFLLSISCHEFAHGFVAYKLGDPTAKLSGRLTLNPIKHFDWFAVIFFLVFRCGWAKGVPINPGYFKNPKRGMVYSSLAGPLTNVLLAFVSAVIFKFVVPIYTTNEAVHFLLSFLSQMIYVNCMLAIFNLIPMPPLDGSKIFFSVLPDRLYYKVMSYDRYMIIISLLLVYFGVLDNVIFNGTTNLIRVLDTASSFIYNLIGRGV